MPQCNRRRFLGNIGAGVALTSTQGLLRTPLGGKPGLEEIAAKLGTASREAAFAVATGFLGEGATWSDVLGGILLLASRDVSPQPIGNRVHAVMMIESAFQLGEATTAADRMLPVLFNLDYVKRSQHGDRGWVLPKLPEGSALSKKDAAKLFTTGMLDWNEGEADRGIVELFRTTPKDELFEIVWPLAARDFRFIGHKAIYAAAMYRSLTRIGWQHAIPVLRSLALGLLDGHGARKDWTATYDANRKLARGMKKHVASRKRDPQTSMKLVERLRTVSVADAGPTIAAELDGGVAPETVWDAYRVFAAETLMRLPGIAGVHPTTSTNGLQFAWQRTRSGLTKKLLLLQGASWLVLFRSDFVGRRGMDMKAPGIDELQAADTAPPVDRIFRDAKRDRRQAAQRVLALLSSGRNPELEETYRKLVFRKGRESHAYKYSAAMLEEYHLCHPELAPRVLAAGQVYLPTAADPDAEVYTRARAALGRQRKGI